MNDTPPRDTAVTPPKGTSLRPAGILICHVCKRQLECTAPKLLEYTRDGWPKCCKEVMSIYERIDKTDTAEAKPV